MKDAQPAPNAPRATKNDTVIRAQHQPQEDLLRSRISRKILCNLIQWFSPNSEMPFPKRSVGVWGLGLRVPQRLTTQQTGGTYSCGRPGCASFVRKSLTVVDQKYPLLETIVFVIRVVPNVEKVRTDVLEEMRGIGRKEVLKASGAILVVVLCRSLGRGQPLDWKQWTNNSGMAPLSLFKDQALSD